MLAVALALLLTPAQPHSAQCLIQVASLAGEDLDITEPVMRSAAVAKTDQLVQIMGDLRDALAELERAQAAFLETVPGLIETGALPPGSAEAIRARHESARAALQTRIRTLEVWAPDCSWRS